MSKASGTSKRTTAVTETTRVPDALSRVVDRFEQCSTLQALGIVAGIAMVMLAYIYGDMLFGDAVLLYTDIGSDTVNYYYPLWFQEARLWSEYGVLHGYSLQSHMGHPTVINPLDLFQWPIIAGGTENIPYRIHIGEIMKALVTLAAGFGAFKLMGMRNLTASIGAYCLAFCGWITLGAAGWHNLATPIVMIVVSLFASEYALQGRKFWYLVSPILFMFTAYVSSYFVFHLSAAVLVYSVIRAAHMYDLRDALRKGGLMLACLAVGLGLAFSPIHDAYVMLTQSGRAEALNVVEGGRMSLKKDKPMTELVDRVELMNVVQRSYSTNALGIGSAFKGMSNYLEAPLLYMGLPMLLFFPLFGLGMTRKDKLVWGGVLAAVLLMLIFPWFRYAFWGFKLDYFREFTMLIGIVMLIVAMWGLDGLVGNRSNGFRLWLPIAAVLMIALPFAVAKPTDGIDASQRLLTTLFLSGTALSAMAYAITRRSAFLLGIVVFTLVDLTINAHATINERARLTRTDIVNGKLFGDGSVKALDWIRINDKSLHRTVKYSASGPAIHASINDAMIQGFHGLIGYTSIHNKYYLRLMAEMGCINTAEPNDAKWVHRIKERPLLASALGATYFVTKGTKLGFVPTLFPDVHQVGDYYIHKSSIALPLLVAHDTYITPQAFSRLQNLRKDLMLYRSVVLDAVTATQLGLKPYDASADTTVDLMPADFASAAANRRSMMSVNASTTVDGLTATVDLSTSALVVIAVPYDPGITVTVDGREAPTVISNIGLVGVKVEAGKHQIALHARP